MAAPMRGAVKSVSCCKSVIFSRFRPDRMLRRVSLKALSVSPYSKPLLSPFNLRRQIVPHKMMCYDSRQVDVALAKNTFIFDTHDLVKRLQESGFTVEQSERIVEILVEMSQAQMDYLNRNIVTKTQQEIMMQQIMSHISSVKKDMVILEKSEFSALKHEYEKQHSEINQLQQHFKDEITKLGSGVKLDLNLEKSRALEAHSENAQQLANIRNTIEMERTDHSKDISSLDNKIDKELANLLATYERYRNDIIKYAAGTVTTCLAIVLGFLRLWS